MGNVSLRWRMLVETSLLVILIASASLLFGVIGTILAGILALAMAATWRRPVMAADIDPQSVAVAEENAAINGLAAWIRFRCSDGMSDREVRRAVPYDLIMANILAGPLVALSARLSACLAPRATLVLSGLLAQQESAVRNAYRRQGLSLRKRIALDGWHTLVMARRFQ